ncbi:claudin-18 isoform X1 [Xenopus tropicalis]|uniref:Claudin 18 n=1 Tax=Xenopus tropicalis TaxID=8364 RepID=A0A6I8RHA0_XENTR|nr:claudin-18 isoform X1 [Xenopus tropicalis]|eukprot:XP_004917830.1 PREDICTED: claudin-18 isoform X2 [Xenopus tropicalis]
MAVTLCQAAGFFISLVGVAGIIAATGMNQWSTQDLYNNPVTAVFNYQGLWQTCVKQTSGFTECRAYFTILGLPAMFQAVRALMIVGIVLGGIGLLVAIFSMKCIRIGSMEDSAKANITLTSGIMFILAGLCSIIGVSVFANMLVTNFWMTTANMYTGGAISGMGGMGGLQTLQTRYTFGAALFVGWVAGGLTMIGGVMMCIACRGLMPEESNYKAVSYHVSTKTPAYKTSAYDEKSKKSIYNESRRSEDGKSYPSKYDYV